MHVFIASIKFDKEVNKATVNFATTFSFKEATQEFLIKRGIKLDRMSQNKKAIAVIKENGEWKIILFYIRITAVGLIVIKANFPKAQINTHLLMFLSSDKLAENIVYKWEFARGEYEDHI